VHSLQLVADARVVIEPHDNALNFIATEAELIRTGAKQSERGGVDWPLVRPDQFADIPFLSELRASLEARKKDP